ncbi:hypothetical protein PR048_021401 [Dryococelus australis]|uniref:Uncharacterized protein n=1 Tax=Dryococelus australis TaxID=614101 RepID=A0ABQ9GYA1_9NEOP|nr:hypothetical protein PR048_021401 [Dryococelus australis]
MRAHVLNQKNHRTKLKAPSVWCCEGGFLAVLLFERNLPVPTTLRVVRGGLVWCEGFGKVSLGFVVGRVVAGKMSRRHGGISLWSGSRDTKVKPDSGIARLAVATPSVGRRTSMIGRRRMRGRGGAQRARRSVAHGRASRVLGRAPLATWRRGAGRLSHGHVSAPCAANPTLLAFLRVLPRWSVRGQLRSSWVTRLVDNARERFIIDKCRILLDPCQETKHEQIHRVLIDTEEKYVVNSSRTQGGRGGRAVSLLAPTKPRPGRSRIFGCANRAGRCRWSAGFLGDLPFPPVLTFRRCLHTRLASPSSPLNTEGSSISVAREPNKGTAEAQWLENSIRVLQKLRAWENPIVGPQLICNGVHDHLAPEVQALNSLDDVSGRASSIADDGEARRVWSSADTQGRGETGDPQVNPTTIIIVRHDSHVTRIRELPRRESNPVHLGGRWVVCPLHHRGPCRYLPLDVRYRSALSPALLQTLSGM